MSVEARGTYDGSELTIDLAEDHGTYVSPLYLELAGPLDGDAWTPTFASLYTTGTYPTFSCTLERQ